MNRQLHSKTIGSAGTGKGFYRHLPTLDDIKKQEEKWEKEDRRLCPSCYEREKPKGKTYCDECQKQLDEVLEIEIESLLSNLKTANPNESVD